MDEMAQVREAWKRAAEFPIDKERVYPEHAEAQEFDKRRPGEKVLEYGCGGGSDTLSYLRRGCEVLFLDVVLENVEATARWVNLHGFDDRASGRVLEDSAVLPEMTIRHLLTTDEFDVVNCHGVLHHIREPLPVLREFHRVLKPGGMLYLMLYTEGLWEFHHERMLLYLNQVGVRARDAFEAFAWATDGPGVPYARAYTEAGGREILEATGFAVRSTFEYLDCGGAGKCFRTFRAVKPER